MAIIKYDMKNFIAALEPGIVSLVVSTFEEKLQEKLNGIVESVYEELRKELPEEIKARVLSVFDAHADKQKIIVEVDLKEKS